MPASMLKSFATKSGKSMDEVEKAWEDAKTAASVKFKTRPENAKGGSYWAYVTALTEKMLGLRESVRPELSNLLEEIDKANEVHE